MMRVQLKNITAACEKKLDEKLHCNIKCNIMGTDHVADAFAAYAYDLNSSGEGEVLGNALLVYSDLQRQLLSFRKSLETDLREQVVKPLNQFVDVDIKKMCTTKSQYHHVRKTYDAMRTKLRDLEFEKKTDLGRMFSLHQEAAATGTEFFNIQTKTLQELEDVNLRRDIDVVSHIRNLLSVQSDYYRKCFNLFREKEVLIQQLQQYSEQAKLTYQESKSKREEQMQNIYRETHLHKYDTLVELLASPNLIIVSGLIEVLQQAKADEVVVSIVRILDYYNCALPLVESEISRQVQETQEPSTIFRGNTTATKLMTAFTKMIGRDYIINTLKPSLQYVVDNPEDYEIDPTKVTEADNLQLNISNLLQITENFIDHIIGSTDRCPLPLRVICRHLRSEVSRKFDARAGVIAVSGMMFLRFFCPNILAPVSMGILSSPPSAQTMRVLMLITKTMQNLVNYAEFSPKEGYMSVMDEFVKKKRPIVIAWYDELTDVPPDWVQMYTPCASLQDLFTNDFPLVEEVCRAHYKKLAKDLGDDKVTQAKMCQVLAHLEQCIGSEQKVTAPPISTTPSSENVAHFLPGSLRSSMTTNAATTPSPSTTPTPTPTTTPTPTPTSSPIIPLSNLEHQDNPNNTQKYVNNINRGVPKLALNKLNQESTSPPTTPPQGAPVTTTPPVPSGPPSPPLASSLAGARAGSRVPKLNLSLTQSGPQSTTNTGTNISVTPAESNIPCTIELSKSMAAAAATSTPAVRPGLPKLNLSLTSQPKPAQPPNPNASTSTSTNTNLLGLAPPSNASTGTGFLGLAPPQATHLSLGANLNANPNANSSPSLLVASTAPAQHGSTPRPALGLSAPLPTVAATNPSSSSQTLSVTGVTPLPQARALPQPASSSYKEGSAKGSSGSGGGGDSTGSGGGSSGGGDIDERDKGDKDKDRDREKREHRDSREHRSRRKTSNSGPAVTSSSSSTSTSSSATNTVTQPKKN
ncbi:gtpase-activator protein for Ras family gtpase [Pelomyxa schiedti]|nr:gtpase-activator protein for Ras family gtpase [Pelomyxa schiedti]